MATVDAHPDITWILDQIDRDLPALGVDAAAREVIAVIEALATDQTSGKFDEGIDDSVTVCSAYCQRDEYVARVATTDDLTYDPAPVMAALTAVMDEAKTIGYANCLTDLRELRDENPPPEAPDPDDYEDTDEFQDDVDLYEAAVDYATAVEAAIAAVQNTFAFDDPDPDWKPAE